MNLDNDLSSNSLPFRSGSSKEEDRDVGANEKVRSSSPFQRSRRDVDQLKQQLKSPPREEGTAPLKKRKGEETLLDGNTVTKKMKKRAKKKWKKPKDKPSRPLSAYNLFFQSQRAKMLGADAPTDEDELRKKRVHCKTHGKIGFAEMARTIGSMWKNLDPAEKKVFEDKARLLKDRYVAELAKWKANQKEDTDTTTQEEKSHQDKELPEVESILSHGSVLRRNSNSSEPGTAAFSAQHQSMMARRLSDLSASLSSQPAAFQQPGLSDQVQLMLARERVQMDYVRALREQQQRQREQAAALLANYPNAAAAAGLMLPSHASASTYNMNVFPTNTRNNNPFVAGAELRQRLDQTRRLSLLMSSSAGALQQEQQQDRQQSNHEHTSGGSDKWRQAEQR